MFKVYDKAEWHIDAGENSKVVISRFKLIMNFLKAKSMLSNEGEEIIDIGIDSSISIHERMLTNSGKEFIESYYDNIIDKNENEIPETLEEEYNKFIMQRTEERY